jgi:hypothetical protein
VVAVVWRGVSSAAKASSVSRPASSTWLCTLRHPLDLSCAVRRRASAAPAARSRFLDPGVVPAADRAAAGVLDGRFSLRITIPAMADDQGRAPGKTAGLWVVVECMCLSGTRFLNMAYVDSLGCNRRCAPPRIAQLAHSDA